MVFRVWKDLSMLTDYEERTQKRENEESKVLKAGRGKRK